MHTQLNMGAIETALRGAQRACDAVSDPARDAFGEPVVENILAGYAFVDELVSAGADPLAIGQVRHLLEMNALVLCGADAARRALYAGHLKATEQRFYEQPGAGVGDLVENMALNAGDEVYERAATAYMWLLSRPQLFVEGNHRTGALVASCVLMRAGQPPFVLSARNAQDYFAASAAFSDLEKHGFRMLLRASGLRRKFAQFLRDQACAELLCHA